MVCVLVQNGKSKCVLYEKRELKGRSQVDVADASRNRRVNIATATAERVRFFLASALLAREVGVPASAGTRQEAEEGAQWDDGEQTAAVLRHPFSGSLYKHGLRVIHASASYFAECN